MWVGDAGAARDCHLTGLTRGVRSLAAGGDRTGWRAHGAGPAGAAGRARSHRASLPLPAPGQPRQCTRPGARRAVLGRLGRDHQVRERRRPCTGPRSISSARDVRSAARPRALPHAQNGHRQRPARPRRRCSAERPARGGSTTPHRRSRPGRSRSLPVRGSAGTGLTRLPHDDRVLGSRGARLLRTCPPAGSRDPRHPLRGQRRAGRRRSNAAPRPARRGS